MNFLGLDAGSVSVKVVLLDEAGNQLQGLYKKHRGHPVSTSLELLREMRLEKDCTIAVTGSAGRLIGEVLGVEPVNEIVAQAYSTRKLYPHIKTIIEMGGEDSKLILMDENGVKDFSMNSVCAAGTGSFLDQQAERLRMTIEELSELALESKKPPRIAGRCSVFAKSDMIHLQQIATPVHDIVSGLCFAVARNFKGSIARGRQIFKPVSFQGGVAANKGMIRAFCEVFDLDELFVPPDFALMGAMGAALKALDEGMVNTIKLEAIEAYLIREKDFGKGHASLRDEDDGFYERHLKDERDIIHTIDSSEKVRAYMGIDIGSISTNLAVIDEHGNLLAKRYLMTAGRPIEAVRQGLSEIAEEVGDTVDVVGVGTTGSGRYMIADFVGADIVKNEITAQATAAAFIDRDVDTIFEIGGQDSKYVSLRDGVIVDFEMNKACAAGTGSFLEEQAEKLNISIKKEFAECAFSSDCPSRLGERCTVFMENSLMANLQKGVEREDLLAGLAFSIVQNYINRVVAGRSIGKKIFFQGGVAFNKSVVAAFEKYLGTTVVVPPNHDVTGAIGMALIAMRHMLETGETRSTFKGFDLSKTPYEISSFECKGCSNRCEINRVKIEGEKGRLFYGGRCEKYDINKKEMHGVPDLFKFRDEQLWKVVSPPKGNRPIVGIPYIFFFNEFLPYWYTLLDKLGFDVEVSPRPDRQIIDLGLASVISEACYPVKVALGHIRYLKDKGVETIFCPSFINLNTGDDEYERGVACPHTQTIPYVSKVAIEGLNIVSPVVDMSRGDNYLAGEIKKALKGLKRLSNSAILRAMKDAQKAQEEFHDSLKAKGREVLTSLDRKAIVIVGRSYNAFERGMNLQIPEKLATLGVLAIPMDMLPTGDVRLQDTWPNMYWRSGQRILRAARFMADNEYLYPLMVGNFSCGPDSFILKFFTEELGGKPYLHIEIDEHSADAGAITRCEAFLDSIEHRSDKSNGDAPVKRTTKMPTLNKRTVYLPPMSDHAFAVAAVFERCGLPSEVLPESDKETVDLGMKYASGKECYPCVVTTGDMVKKALSKDFRPSESAFFMPSGSGPCRFGQYNVFHKNVLENMGFHDVPVFAPNQDDGFYQDLGLVNKDFVKYSWQGIVAVDLLTKCLHETRPYEKEEGETDALYNTYLRRICNSLSGTDGRIEDVLSAMKKDFEVIPKHNEKKPAIGIIGEIFVRSNRFSNEDLVRKIEDLGGEVWIAPIEEWIQYIGYTGLQKAWLKREYSAIIDSLIKKFYKRRIEHKYARFFEGYLGTLHEPTTEEIIGKASPYVHESFEGETILSMGKAVDLAERGACGVVNTMPFGCMPGTIVSALLRAFSKKYDLPSISIPYDGTESSTTEIQLEAFMDQAKTIFMQRR